MLLLIPAIVSARRHGWRDRRRWTRSGYCNGSREGRGGSPGNATLQTPRGHKNLTTQREMQQAADNGYEYLGQTVFETAFGGPEVVIIMERDRSRNNGRPSYRLLATSKTSTMQQELTALGEQGYRLMGLTVGKTAIGGDEIISILRKD